MKSRLLTKHYLLCLISLNILLKEINSGQTTEGVKQIFLMSIYQKYTQTFFNIRSMNMSLQEQYNLVPGNYAKEMASLSIVPHLKSMAVEISGIVSKSLKNLISGRGK